MKTNLRFVIDTNAIVSALLIPDSKPRQAFDRAHEKGKLLLSIETLTELNDVLSLKKFDRYLHEDERKQFLVVFAREAELVEVTETITDCRDAKDNKILEVGVCGKADCIISGDQDLLDLHPFRGIQILRPEEFLKEF